MSKPKTLLIVLVGAVVAVGALFAVRAANANPDRILSKADKFYASREFDEARLEYLKVLRVDPQNARAFRQLGLVWAEMGAPVQSGSYLKHVSETNPDDLEVQRGFAKALLGTGQVQPARTAALALLEKNPADGEALVMLANTSFTEEEVRELAAKLESFDREKSAAYHLASAVIASRKGNLGATKDSLDLAMAISPESDEVHLAMSSYYEAVKDRPNVLASLKKASELAPNQLLHRLRYARALAGDGKRDEAVAMVKSTTESYRYFLPGWLLLAEMSLQANDTKAATTHLNEVLSRDTMNPDARMLRATVLQAEGKLAEANREMEETSRIFYGNVVIKLSLAKGFLRDNNPLRAIATLEEILAASPNYAEADLLLAQARIGTGAADAAAASMEKLLERMPGLFQAEQLLASAYQKQGKMDEAADVFRRQIARNGEQAGPHFLLGMILRQQGKSAGALASLQKAQSLAPKDPAIAFQLIELDIERKDFESAMRRTTELETHHPTSWTPPFLRGKVFSAQEKWEEAEQALLKALAIQPDSLTIYNQLLDGYMRQGRIPEVITSLEDFLKEKPKSTPQRMILALLCGQEGLTDKQVEAYEQILVDDPNSITALNNLSYLNASALNNLPKAQELATRARTLQPDSPEIADTLGWILYQQKNYPQALTLIEEAAGKIPDNAEVQYHLGMARYMSGQKDTARTALEKALSIKSDFPGSDKAREYLSQLTGDGTPDKAPTVESLTQRLKESPGDVVSRTRLAGMQEAAGQFKEAAANYEEALKGNAGLVEAMVSLSRLYGGPLQNPAKATEFARRARSLEGKNPAAARVLGEALLREGDFRYAATLLQEAATAAKDDPALKSKMAEAAYATGKTADARRVSQEVADQAGDAAAAAAAKRFLVLTGAPDPALATAAAEALKENPDNLPALMAQTASLPAPQAIPALEALLKKVPEFIPAQIKLASLLATQPGRADEAQNIAEKARLVLPGDPVLARTLGIIRFQKENYDDAVRLLRESETKTPLDAEGLYYLGRSQLGAGQKDLGIATLKRAMEGTLPEDLKTKAQAALDEATTPPAE